ncbi:MAG: hypothetical protein ACTSR3_00455 [Candidatus Helarchaeota archaeon]
MSKNSKLQIKKILNGIGKIFKWIGIIIALLMFILMGMVIYWLVRPNTSFVFPLFMENWVAVSTEDTGIINKHNSNTDLVYFNGSFYLVHQNSPYHLGSKSSKIMVWKSSDARTWQLNRIFYYHEDIRDPKFAIIGSRLYIYTLVNFGGLIASPETTLYAYTEDGESWTEFEFLEPYGWLFWRPKTYDNATWYCTAYWHEHGASVLLNSTDGVNWDFVSFIYLGERNDETACEFMPDGKLIVTCRAEGNIESLFGDNTGSTIIATSNHPFEKWTFCKNTLTRLDGPILFRYNGKIFAIGRFEPENDPIIYQRGSFFTRKRTSIFQVTEAGLIYLTDLPSDGDTTYAGVVIKDDQAYISYYTSPINQDIPWILGVISKSDIRMAKIDMNQLSSLADLKLAENINNYKKLELPWMDYFAFSLILITMFSLVCVCKKYKAFSKKKNILF